MIKIKKLTGFIIFLPAEQAEQINKLIEKIEEDEDVQNVFHNMAE